MAKQKLNAIIAVHAPVEITAADGEKGQGKFDVTAYNGGPLEVGGWDRPVVIDVDGMEFHKNVIANLGHDSEQFVGHVTAKEKADGTVKLGGVFSAETAARDTIVKSAANGFPFEASVEVTPKRGGVEAVDAGKSIKANGQSFDGPLYVARKSTLTGFGFVLRGADPDTVVNIAANAASHKEQEMRKEVKAWVESLGFVADELTDDQVASMEATYAGLNGKKPVKASSGNPFEKQKLEAKRRDEIQAISNTLIDRRKAAGGGYISEADITAIENMQDHAIEADMSPVEYKAELQEAMLPVGVTIHAPKDRPELNAEVIEAAICMNGRLPNVEKQYSDKTLQAAHDQFKHGIGLGQVLMLGAIGNGYQARPGERVTDGNLKAILSAVFANVPIRGAAFSTYTIPTTLSNVANKFVRDGWNFVEQSWREISTIRPVNDFKEITTVSLVDGLMFDTLNPGGEIKHGTISETTYGNKADTYARMFAIDRRDIINDDLGALTVIPRKLGRGGALKMNDIFWAEWINPTTANFWHANNANVNEGVATMTIAGLAATEIIFMAQTGPDGNILGSMPSILLVPPVHKAAALTLMSSERLIDGTATATQGDNNIWRGRFKVVSSQYLGSTAYTGFDVDAWWMLSDPNDIAAIEVVALNGRVEPTLDTAEADFNVLGIQMRGYCDVGVRVQEPRAGVRSDNGSS